jgi:hypothetical protein
MFEAVDHQACFMVAMLRKQDYNMLQELDNIRESQLNSCAAIGR